MPKEELNLKSPAALHTLQQPEKLEKVMGEIDKYDDCLSCRLTGTAAFVGLGAYSYFSGQRQLELQRQKILKSGSMFGIRSRQYGITGIALTFVGLGFWRLVN